MMDGPQNGFYTDIRTASVPVDDRDLCLAVDLELDPESTLDVLIKYYTYT